MANRGAGKLNAAIQKQISELLRKGQYINAACAYVGIHKSTYFDWVERGNAARALRDQGKPVPRPELPYLRFLDEVELAKDYGEAWLVERLLEAIADPKTRGQWQGYMTMLERTRPDRFRRRASTEYGGEKPSVPSVFTFDPEKLSNDELEQLKLLFAKAKPTED